MTTMEGCEGCGFIGGLGTKIEVCDYFGYTGQLRGCPGGAECTKRMTPEAVREKYGDPCRRQSTIEVAAAKAKRTTVEIRKAVARDQMRREDRGDMARQLGMSPKAAEALYGGRSKK